MARLLVLSAILGVVGCAPQWSQPRASFYEPTDLLICVDLPERHLDAAREAITGWDTALRGWKRVRMVHALPYAECNLTVAETSSWKPEDSASAGWTSRIGGSEIFLVRGRYEHMAAVVLSHEIGHAMGASHVDRTLMNPTLTPEMRVCPDVTTIAQVAAFHHLDLDVLAWCYP